MLLDWLLLPQKQKTGPRRGRRRRAIPRLLPSTQAGLGGRSATEPFNLYPCTRMHGAGFEAEFHPEVTAA